jgi:hypothetical protein
LREEENAILPSGDHEGERFMPPKRGKATMRLRSKEYIMISQPPLGERTEGQARAIGRDARRERNASQVRDLLLVGAIVVHHPDFFVAGALADEIDFAFGDALYASAEAEDDFVGKAVRDDADRVGVALSVYCLPSTCGDFSFLTS